MNKEAIAHSPCSKQCFAIGEKTVVLRLQIAKTDRFSSVKVIYGNKYNFYLEQNEATMEVRFSDGVYNYYTIKLDLDDVRFVYIFKIIDGKKVYFFSEDGITESYDFKFAYYNAFQLPYINKADVHETVEWLKSAVFYEVFIERFCRGDFSKDDSYINLKWGEIPSPKSFTGGDLKGIIEKLDYIKELGANVLYLTPIFKSISNHKYDISDYFLIDPNFGTNEVFRELVKKAHEKGIRIVLDAVFNHCSENLPEFKDVVKNGKASRYYDWFIIRGDYPDKEKQNYEVFASCDYMPKFNTSNEETQEYLLNIGAHWIKEYGIDGWRLDVSDEVSHKFWRKFRERIKQEKSDAVIIGENWHDANPFLRGDEYDSIMNYAFTKASLDFFVKRCVSAKEFGEKLSALIMRNSDPVNEMMLNILDSHDTHRFYTELKKDGKRLRSALAVMFMFVGAPGIYYGTEIELEGGYDPDCRRNMDWEKAKTRGETFECIKALSALKSKEPLKNGEIKFGEEKGLFVILRKTQGATLKLIVNNLEKDAYIGEKDIVYGQEYKNGTLASGGFIIIDREG